MATIDNKPSRRRPGYTRQDVEAARRPPAPTKRTARLLESRDVDRRVVGIADDLLRNEDADAPMGRNG